MVIYSRREEETNEQLKNLQKAISAIKLLNFQKAEKFWKGHKRVTSNGNLKLRFTNTVNMKI